jgi:hypothetical protein
MISPADPDRWGKLEAPRMIYSSIDWNSRVNGYSGFWPPGYLNYVQELNQFPSPRSLEILRQLRVRWVMIHVQPNGRYHQLTAAEANGMIAALPPGTPHQRYGNSWLVDLGRS